MRVVEVLTKLIANDLDQDEAYLLLAAILNQKAGDDYDAMAEHLDDETLECLRDALRDEAAKRAVVRG